MIFMILFIIAKKVSLNYDMMICWWNMPCYVVCHLIIKSEKISLMIVSYHPHKDWGLWCRTLCRPKGNIGRGCSLSRSKGKIGRLMYMFMLWWINWSSRTCTPLSSVGSARHLVRTLIWWGSSRKDLEVELNDKRT